MIVDSVLALPTLRGLHLTRTFGEGETTVTALDDVSLDLFQGQITLLMGPSGSGKSTLLAVLSGLLQPTHGEVVIQGEELWKMSERQRKNYRLEHFGFIFQGYNLFPALTARQQLEMVLRRARECRADWPGFGPRRSWAFWGCPRRPTCGRWKCPAARSSGWPLAGP